MHCKGPMIAIIERIAGELPSFAPDLVADPKVSLFRQFRDTRFSGDKTPLKTHIGATFPNRTLGRLNGAGLYFEMAPRCAWCDGGVSSTCMWQMALGDDALNTFREEAVLCVAVM